MLGYENRISRKEVELRVFALRINTLQRVRHRIIGPMHSRPVIPAARIVAVRPRALLHLANAVAQCLDFLRVLRKPLDILTHPHRSSLCKRCGSLDENLREA